MHGDVEVLDHLAEQGAAALVDLQRHEPRGQLHDVRGHAQQAQRAGGLKAEQAAADHQAGPPAAGAHGRALRRAADRVEVVEGAVDEASGQVPARDRRDERVRAGGQHQRVVAEGAAAAGGDGAGGPVDGGHRLVQAQRVPGRVVAALGDDIEVSRGGAVEIRRQRDPVVGAARLLRQHGNPPRPARIAVPHGLDKPLADHPVADDDEMALLVLHTGLPHALTTSHSGAPPCQAQ